MKFSLIAAVVVLALAQGSFAQDRAQDLERLGQYFEEMKNKMTVDLLEIIRSHDLATQAQTFMEDRKTQLEPMATKIQDQLRSVAIDVEEQMKPLATSLQTQIQPMMENFQKQLEAVFQKLTEPAKGIDN